jgi:hypothetical protein
MFQMNDRSEKPKDAKLDRNEIHELADIYINYKQMFEINMDWYNKNKFWVEKKITIVIGSIKNIDNLSHTQQTSIYNTFKNWNIDYWYYKNTILKEKTYKACLDEYYKTYNFNNHMKQINLYNQPMIKVLAQRSKTYGIRHI